jgi:hypothetical protein
MPQLRNISHVTALVFLAVLGSALASIGACTSSSAGPSSNDSGGEDAGYSVTVDAGGTDAGGDATVVAQDSGLDATVVTPDGGGDSSISDAGVDATSDATLLDLSWAQWLIPNSPSDIEAGAPNPESYTNNGDGTVTDNVTHLMWQQTPLGADGGAYPAFVSGDAPAYCTGLTLAGHSDWRLPSVIELVSIVDYSAPNDTPLVNAVFAGTPLNWFWTADADLGAGTVWAVHFQYGYAQYPSIPNDPFPVRCVRGGGPGPFASTPSGAPPGRYTVQGTGGATTVYDNVTHLTWQQQGPDGGTFATGGPSDAVAYCAGVTLNGMQARVPTVNELFSLYDFSNPGSTTAAIDPTYFPGTPANLPFWSSTTAVISTYETWSVFFSGGGTQPSPDTTTYYAVRCVH